MDMADSPTGRYIRNATLDERFRCADVRAQPAGNSSHDRLRSTRLAYALRTNFSATEFMQ